MTESLNRSSGNRHSGEIAATLLSVWLGLASLVCSHLWSVAKPERANLFLLKMSVWIPGWEKIGPYAGKETIGLIVWLMSWLLLFFLLKNREFSLKHCDLRVCCRYDNHRDFHLASCDSRDFRLESYHCLLKDRGLYICLIYININFFT